MSTTPIRYLRMADVVERTGLTRGTIYNAMGAGEFPRPHQLTTRRVGWLESEVNAWLESRQVAAVAGK